MRKGERFLSLTLPCAVLLSGCAGGPSEFMREPRLSPVGSGLTPSASQYAADIPANVRPAIPANAINLFTDQRIARVGDIVTVVISINDKATFGNETDRTQTAKAGYSWDAALKAAHVGTLSATATGSTDVSSSSTAQGQGNINRTEQIQVSIAAIVTDVLPNGNLLVSGSQEVRVNFELRQLTVAGIVRPSDIARNNTIAYDHIAEARISYGGRGRISEVQQPAWGQQIYDIVKPF